MKNIYLESKLSSIDISDTLQEKLKLKNIIYVKDLWLLKREDLKALKFNVSEINEIIIKMQLHGLDLNKKIYSKN